MTRKVEMLAVTILLLMVRCTQIHGQTPPPTILQVELANVVQYFGDISDVTKFATDPNITTPLPARAFQARVTLADIVAINGQPAKGTAMFNTRVMLLRTAPNPGEAIADTTRFGIDDHSFEILQADGTPIGTIMAMGLPGGSAVPGSPLEVTQGPGAIVGGTGAFRGARGETGTRTGIPGGSGPRVASMAEDPAKRRQFPGGRIRFILTVIPMFRPEVVMTPNGPAVTHSGDFALVSTSRPAAAGEILSLFVTGLGPVRPGVDPGKPFPSSPLAAVNSPVEVTVNGRPAEVTAAVGYPGSVDGYQVNFRVPSETARGTATIQVTAAWIAGPEVRIAIQ